MTAVWQVQEAKNRFSEMIERAQTSGPQVITRHGRAVARVVAAGPLDPLTEPASSAATRLTHAAGSFAQYLLSVPKVDGLEVPVRRSRKAPLVLGA